MSSHAGLQIVRIGGGAYDRTMPSNEQLLKWCQHIQAMDAEPMIQVSQYLSGKQAAAIVRFFNVDKKMSIKFWNIGNETWLRRNRPPIETVPALVAKYVKPLASAMKEVDPSVKIFVCDECDYFDALYEGLISGPSDVCGKDENGRYYIDGFSWHRYVSGDRDWVAKNAAKDFRVRAAKCRDLVVRANRTHSRVGKDALEWGIGEFNLENKGYQGPSTTQGSGVHSFVNGQFFAEVYGICMKYNATYAVEHVSTWWPAKRNGVRLPRRARADAKTFFSAHATYRPELPRRLRGRFQNLPDVRVFGCTSEGQCCALILNLEASGEREYTLRLDGGEINSGCGINIDCGMALPAYEDTIANQTTQVLVFGFERNANSQIRLRT